MQSRNEINSSSSSNSGRSSGGSSSSTVCGAATRILAICRLQLNAFASFCCALAALCAHVRTNIYRTFFLFFGYFVLRIYTTYICLANGQRVTTYVCTFLRSCFCFLLIIRRKKNVQDCVCACLFVCVLVFCCRV